MRSYWIKYGDACVPLRSGEAVLGRSPYATLVIANPSASREHAVLRLVGQRLEVVDLGSTNGTEVNGQPLRGARALVAGDRVRIGTDEIEVLEIEVGNEARRATVRHSVESLASLEAAGAAAGEAGAVPRRARCAS